MLVKRVFLACACASLILAQPPKQPPQQQKRDLRIEKIENEGGEPPPARKFNIPRSYALVVGISKYKNLPNNQLLYAVADAQLMYSVLISQEGGNFPAENVRVLLNEQATLANMRKEINTWLPGEAKEDDRVLIYFAGHGFIDPKSGKGYLAPYDIEKEHIPTTGFPMDELGQTIGSKIRAKSKILLTDACHSGAITPDDTLSLNSALLKLNTSLFSLTASKDREQSLEGAGFGGGHGVFTYFVKLGMEGAADNAPTDGMVTADELAEYVHSEVRRATDARQNPTSEKGSFDPAMFIALVPANAPPGVPPPPKTGVLVFVSNMDTTTILVDGKDYGIVNKGGSLRTPGLPPGIHTVQGVHSGYEPDGPREESVYPGLERTVTINIGIPRRRKQAAVDLFNKGFSCYLGKQDCNKSNRPDYQKAVDSFQKALEMEPTYGQAADYLARTYNALFDEANAEKFFKKAIQIDFDNMDARSAYAGMLLDRMDSQEAIRQLTIVVQRQPNNAEAFTHLSQAFRLKGDYPQSIAAAQKAIQLAPTLGEPHLWLGDSLRLSGKNVEAGEEYEKCLKFTNFDPGVAGQLHYYVIGSLIGLGRRHRAAEHDVWKDLRGLAYFGLCDSEKRLKNYDTAIAFCQKSLGYSAQDPFAHYVLGLSIMLKANAENSVPGLDSAVKHLRKVIEINPDIDEAHLAATNINNIQQALADYHRQTIEYRNALRPN